MLAYTGIDLRYLSSSAADISYKSSYVLLLCIMICVIYDDASILEKSKANTFTMFSALLSEVRIGYICV